MKGLTNVLGTLKTYITVSTICSFTLKYLLRSCRVHFLNCLQLRTLFIFNCFQFARTALQSHCPYGSVGTRSTNVCTLTSNIQPDVMLHLHDGVFCVSVTGASHTHNHTHQLTCKYQHILRENTNVLIRQGGF